jgi:flavin-dependent thymidylate synthase
MKVTLSGFNVDADLFRELSQQKRVAPSPETLTAAYARISHSPEAIETLRRNARRQMEKARKSNEAIIFELRHGSVSEHAVLNFDVTGISRVATEELEHFRLASYTERSQRYVKLADEFVIPEEIRSTPYVQEFIRLVEFQNNYYHELRERLLAHFVEKYPEQAENPEGRRRLEIVAQEDARYVTSLSTATQLGMTLNSRALRLMLRRFASHPLIEVRRLGETLYSQARSLAPSLLPEYQANDFDRKTRPALRELADRTMVDTFIFKRRVSSDVELVDYTLNADNKVLAALLYTVTKKSFEECLKKASKMIMNQRRELFKTACQYMESHQAPLREFEYVYLTFDVVASAACFAQLKRHRMLTLTSQQYEPSLGLTVPASIEEIRETARFRDLAGRCQELYDKIKGSSPPAAQYTLMNAHQRRVLVSINARELYHLTRLREDKTAQWDIRDKTRKMVELAKHILPLTLLLTGGKDQYPALYQELYGKPLSERGQGLGTRGQGPEPLRPWPLPFGPVRAESAPAPEPEPQPGKSGTPPVEGDTTRSGVPSGPEAGGGETRVRGHDPRGHDPDPKRIGSCPQRRIRSCPPAIRARARTKKAIKRTGVRRKA